MWSFKSAWPSYSFQFLDTKNLKLYELYFFVSLTVYSLGKSIIHLVIRNINIALVNETYFLGVFIYYDIEFYICIQLLSAFSYMVSLQISISSW